MFLGGLWHGASWNFIIWGLLHGSLLGFERSRRHGSSVFKLRRPLRIALTFIFVLIAWVFFRAETLSSAVTYLGGMFGLVDVPETSQLVHGIVYKPYYLLMMCLAASVVWGGPQSWDWTRQLTFFKVVVIGLLMSVAVLLLTLQSYNPFIYFNF
jgi:alginate O-acetyltransferase complex protein AlgI